MQHQSIAVTYTGKEDPFVERNYGSALTFRKDQSRVIPAELAHKLLRHADVFTLTLGGVDATPPLAAAAAGAASAAALALDDTAAQLEKAALVKEEENNFTNQRQNVVDQVNLMDKDALKEYAQTNYRQPLPKTMTVETMRAKVVGMIDQFGIA